MKEDHLIFDIIKKKIETNCFENSTSGTISRVPHPKEHESVKMTKAMVDSTIYSIDRSRLTSAVLLLIMKIFAEVNSNNETIAHSVIYSLHDAAFKCNISRFTVRGELNDDTKHYGAVNNAWLE